MSDKCLQKLEMIRIIDIKIKPKGINVSRHIEELNTEAIYVESAIYSKIKCSKIKCSWKNGYCVGGKIERYDSKDLITLTDQLMKVSGP